MNLNRSWIITVIALDMIVVVVIGGYFLLRSQAGSMTQAISTTTASAQSSDPTWVLPGFDGSVLLTGSVGTEISASDTSWVEDDEGWSSLVIDGARAYALGDSICLDAGCDTELVQLIDGARFVWVTETATGFSDELNHAIAPSGESLAACWSGAHDGPVVVILGDGGIEIDRAWVLGGFEGSTTWLGLDPGTIGRSDVLPLPFAGYDLPTC